MEVKRAGMLEETFVVCVKAVHSITMGELGKTSINLS